MREWHPLGFGLLAAAFFALALALYALLGPQPENRCEMSYMYQVPQFIEVPMDGWVSKHYPNYRLIVYGEGLYSEYLRSMDLDGIPVLFIPGNAGSSRQVRSLGSVSQTKSAKASHLPVFNYFALDFDEELSGLYGGYAWNQTRFLEISIRRIFGLYASAKNPPKRVVLVGHSVGGLVARGVFLLPGFNVNLVSLIVTLATPHRGPEQEKKAEDLRLMLWEKSGEGLGKVWAPMDHLCIVWCNELVRVTTRALFDLVDPLTSQITTNRSRMGSVLDFHFGESGLGPKRVGTSLTKADHEIRFSSMREVRQLNTHLGHAQDGITWNLKMTQYEDIKIVKTSPRSLPTMLYKAFIHSGLVGMRLFALSTQDSDAVFFLCHPDEGCARGTARRGHKIIPPLSLVEHVALTEEMEGRSFVVPTNFHSPPEIVTFVAYDPNDATYVDSVVLNIWDSLVPFKSYSWNLDKRQPFFNVSISNYASIMQVYSVSLHSIACDKDFESTQIAAVSFEFQGSPSESYHRHFRHPFNATDDILIRRQLLWNSSDEEAAKALLQVFLNPSCSYTLTLTPVFHLAFGEVLRQFATAIPTLCASQLLFLLAFLDSSHFHLGPATLRTAARYIAAINLYYIFILISSTYPTLTPRLCPGLEDWRKPGMDLPVAATLCLLSLGVLALGYAAPALLLLATSRLSLYSSTLFPFAASFHFIPEGKDYCRKWRRKEKEESEENGVKPPKNQEAVEETSQSRFGISMASSLMPLSWRDCRLSLCGVSAVALVGGWNVPGQPLIVAFTLYHLVHFLLLGWRGGEWEMGIVQLEMNVASVAALSPSIIVWTKTALTRRYLGLERLAIDPASNAALLAIIATTLPSHPGLGPYRPLVWVLLGVLVEAGSGSLPALAEALSLAVGLALNPAWAPHTATTATKRKTP